MTRPLRAWILANAVGEMAGLGLGAVGAIVGQRSLEAHLPALVAAVVAAVGFAVVEGVIVGLAQGRVIARLAPGLPVWRWVRATMLGGLIAWLAVSIPFALGAGSDPDAAATEPALVLQLLAMALAGLAAGPILGLPQAFALRWVCPRPWVWIWANAKAWALGLPLVQLVAGGMPPGWPLPVLALVAALVLAATGAVVGRVHGPTLLRLLAVPSAADRRVRQGRHGGWSRSAPASGFRGQARRRRP